MTYMNKYGNRFEFFGNITEGTGVDGVEGMINIKSDTDIDRSIHIQISGSLSDRWKMKKDQIVAIFDMIAKIAVEKSDFNNKGYNSYNTKNCYSFNDFMNILSKEFTAAKEKRIGFK